MINATKKWIFLKLSGAILIPLMTWFILSLNTIYNQEYIDIVLSFAESFKVDGSMNDNAAGHLFVLEKA